MDREREPDKPIYTSESGPDAALKWGYHEARIELPRRLYPLNPLLLGDENGGTWIAWEDFRNQVNYLIQLNHLHGDGQSPCRMVKLPSLLFPATKESGHDP